MHFIVACIIKDLVKNQSRVTEERCLEIDTAIDESCSILNATYHLEPSGKLINIENQSQDGNG